MAERMWFIKGPHPESERALLVRVREFMECHRSEATAISELEIAQALDASVDKVEAALKQLEEAGTVVSTTFAD